jgi:ABC-type multidrug transport system fused ATPase/permease subunit
MKMLPSDHNPTGRWTVVHREQMAIFRSDTPIGTRRRGRRSAGAGRAGRLFTFTKPHTIHFALTVLNAVKGVALQILTPYLLQAVTDRVVDGRMQAFMHMLLLAGGIFVVDAILTLLGRRAAVRYLNYTIRDLRDRATAHVQRLPIAYLDAFHTGDLTSRLNADVGKIADWLASIPEQAVQPLLFLGGFIYISPLQSIWRCAMRHSSSCRCMVAPWPIAARSPSGSFWPQIC